MYQDSYSNEGTTWIIDVTIALCIQKKSQTTSATSYFSIQQWASILGQVESMTLTKQETRERGKILWPAHQSAERAWKKCGWKVWKKHVFHLMTV